MRIRSEPLKRFGIPFLLSTPLVVFLALWVRAAQPAGPAAPSVQNPDSLKSTPSPLPPLPKIEKPVPQQPAVGLSSDKHLDKSPPRATQGLDLVKAGWTYNCMECHKLFPARWHYEDRPLNEHKNIHLEHGNNRFCLNCHHPTNRNAFVDYDGSEIQQSDVVHLCAKCHGTNYRDWEAGVHGRENGFWKSDRGEKTKLRCIQCHDPHSPKFKDMKPLPPLRYPSRAAHVPSLEHPSSPSSPLKE